MKLLAIGRPRAGIEVQTALTRHAHAELRMLWRMYADGVVREMYSPGGPGVVLILDANSTEAGAAALAKLPLVANQVIDFEIIELQPFAALKVLFSPAEQSITNETDR